MLAASECRPPAPDRDEREIQISDQPAHPVEEAGVAGEEDPLRPENGVAESRAAGPRRTGAFVLGVRRPYRHPPEPDLVVLLHLDDVEPLESRPETTRRHDPRRTGERAQRRLVQ